MQDFSSKGNGDSRYLKSVSDFLTRYPTYEDMAAALVAGTLPIDFNGYNPNGVNQTGTPYNKLNVLTDATATKLGLTSDATPNDAFNKLADGMGAADEADQLKTARLIDGLPFDGTKNITHFGECTTEANNVQKFVRCDGFTLTGGARISVYFKNGNNTKSFTMNVNDTGDYPIYFDGHKVSDARLIVYSNDIIDFVYYNQGWHYLGGSTHYNGFHDIVIYEGTGEFSVNFTTVVEPSIMVISSNKNDIRNEFVFAILTRENGHGLAFFNDLDATGDLFSTSICKVPYVINKNSNQNNFRVIISDAIKCMLNLEGFKYKVDVLSGTWDAV